MIGIHPNNQAIDLKDYNLYTSDPVLRRAVKRAGAEWCDAELVAQGAEYGSAETLQAGEDANTYEPELHTLSRTGERIDWVKFHPSWHTMMAMARRNGMANRPSNDSRPSAWAAYAATLYMQCQVEAGSTCPTTMTKGSIPVLQRNPALYASLADKLASMEHDERDIPIARKRSITVGMGMTEKQGGSDLRTNITRAVPVGTGPLGEEFELTGHKWFFSAPMCDAHLVLAKTDERGASCFFVPRWKPDGTKNPIHIQRLKDKVGNRSNSSSEVEFHGAWGVLVGEEGRGISTIIAMAAITRLDCALAGAAQMRAAFAQALHYTRNRHAFGKALIDQPLMTEVLADMALESEAATLMVMDLAEHFASTEAQDMAWRRVITRVAKFWVTKRAIAVTAEAMEVFGGNGYVETGPMGRLFREAPVNSIWEGSGNVMCLDVLRAISRNPNDALMVLERLGEIAANEPRVLAQVQALRDDLQLPPDALERHARRFTKRLALAVQACLMLQHAEPIAAQAFINSRFDPEWGAVGGITCGTEDAAALLRAAWN
jgi:putative acyl-CoA dehydrogenase